MTIRALRSQHAHAVKCARLYPGRGWPKVVARLNFAIMDRVRPVRRRPLVPSGGPDAPAVRAFTGEPQPKIES